MAQEDMEIQLLPRMVGQVSLSIFRRNFDANAAMTGAKEPPTSILQSRSDDTADPRLFSPLNRPRIASRSRTTVEGSRPPAGNHTVGR